MPFEPVDILSIPGMGKHCAVYACEQLKVVSQNDKQKLEQAKEMTYLKAFYEGVGCWLCMNVHLLLLYECVPFFDCP